MKRTYQKPETQVMELEEDCCLQTGSVEHFYNNSDIYLEDSDEEYEGDVR
jgi:hypothetical protein